MNLHSICVVLMLIFSFTEAQEVATPVEELDITKYLGFWYEMYYDLIASLFQGADPFCTTADFTANGDGTANASFVQRRGSETGQMEHFKGKIEQNGKGGNLTFTFDKSPGLGSNPYWVIALGPVKNGFYEYSVATDPYKLGLYVLARNVTTFKQEYEVQVLDFLGKQGFTCPCNKPKPIPQNSKCTYFKLIKHDASEL